MLAGDGNSALTSGRHHPWIALTSTLNFALSSIPLISAAVLTHWQKVYFGVTAGW